MLFLVVISGTWAASIVGPAEAASSILELLADGRTAEAETVAREAYSSLGTTGQFVRARDLGLLFQAAGVAACKRKDAAQEAAWFGLAGTMARHEPYDPRLGTECKGAFMAAISAAEPDGTFNVLGPVRIDGEERSPGQPLAVPHGTHVVQWLGADGGVVTRMVELEVGETVDVGIAAVMPRSGRHVGLSIAGGVLAVGGGAMLVGSTLALDASWNAAIGAGSEEAGAAALRTSRLLQGIGIGCLGVGVGTLFTTNLLVTPASVAVSGTF